MRTETSVDETLAFLVEGAVMSMKRVIGHLGSNIPLRLPLGHHSVAMAFDIDFARIIGGEGINEEAIKLLPDNRFEALGDFIIVVQPPGICEANTIVDAHGMPWRPPAPEESQEDDDAAA